MIIFSICIVTFGAVLSSMYYLYLLRNFVRKNGIVYIKLLNSEYKLK